MTRIEAKKWNALFERNMVTVVRRKIEVAQAHGTLLVDFEDCTATAEQVIFLMAGFPPHRVQFCGHPATRPHPLPGQTGFDSTNPGPDLPANPENEPGN